MVSQIGECERAPKLAEVDASGGRERGGIRNPAHSSRITSGAHVVVGPKSRIRCIVLGVTIGHDVVFVDNARQRQRNPASSRRRRW